MLRTLTLRDHASPDGRAETAIFNALHWLGALGHMPPVNVPVPNAARWRTVRARLWQQVPALLDGPLHRARAQGLLSYAINRYGMRRGMQDVVFTNGLAAGLCVLQVVLPFETRPVQLERVLAWCARLPRYARSPSETFCLTGVLTDGLFDQYASAIFQLSHRRCFLLHPTARTPDNAADDASFGQTPVRDLFPLGQQGVSVAVPFDGLPLVTADGHAALLVNEQLACTGDYQWAPDRVAEQSQLCLPSGSLVTTRWIAATNPSQGRRPVELFCDVDEGRVSSQAGSENACVVLGGLHCRELVRSAEGEYEWRGLDEALRAWEEGVWWVRVWAPRRN